MSVRITRADREAAAKFMGWNAPDWWLETGDTHACSKESLAERVDLTRLVEAFADAREDAEQARDKEWRTKIRTLITTHMPKPFWTMDALKTLIFALDALTDEF